MATTIPPRVAEGDVQIFAVWLDWAVAGRCVSENRDLFLVDKRRDVSAV
jgi:hypothetical protein